MEETEKLLEKRREREEQISALKNPNEPQVQRRTIRRVMRYLADNPAERVKQLQQVEAQKKKLKKQMTFRLDIDNLRRGSSMFDPPISDPSDPGLYRRSTSAPGDTSVNTPSSSLKEHESSLPHVSGPGRTSVGSASSDAPVPRHRNPLRLMKRRSDYFERQKMRLGGLPTSHSASQSAHSSIASHTDSLTSGSTEHKAPQGQAATSRDGDSVFDVESPTKLITRQFSVASTPESYKSNVDKHPLTTSYERTQSFPAAQVN